MKTTVTQWATKAAGAGAIALLLTTPAFAQSRGGWNQNNTNNDRNGQASSQRDNGNRQYGNNGQAGTSHDNANPTYGNNAQGSYQRDNGNDSYRENQRVNATGKVTSFNRERDGYRVQLDRGESFWVPQSKFGNRARDLRVGVSITLGGIFRGGSIYADAVSWPTAYGYTNGFVRGTVERVDYRTGTVWLRDSASGRLITADVNGRSLRNLRRGEYVELTGQWIRGGVFDVARIDNISGYRR
ncbi:MAG: hypothetical protein JO093_00620 [Acidobacteria bacterium]|nr:hypothetical protein [Acidobacteriota bacterium]MBV9071513.1 hypothetical protein [Acidobacteriota bacterium]MBV9184086.1 hypothetical protein [Acidobacteriota bacterium]